MPQPAVVAASADDLIAAYAQAWQRVIDLETQLMLDPLRAAQVRRLTEMRHAIEAEMDALDTSAAARARTMARQAYRLGVGRGVEFTGIHTDAVERFASGLTDDLLAATTFVRDSTKALIRQIVKDEGLQKLIEGRTALQAGKAMRKVIESHGIHAVVYANGTRQGLAAYTAMAARTTTATAYNVGTINREKATKWFEVFDGPDCGWTAHDSPDKANGRIVTRDEALGQPISHPNCTRAFGGRPDVTTKAQARQAEQGSLERAEREKAAFDAQNRVPAQPERTPTTPSRHEQILARHEKLATPAQSPSDALDALIAAKRAQQRPVSEFLNLDVTTRSSRGVGRPVSPNSAVPKAVRSALAQIDSVHTVPSLGAKIDVWQTSGQRAAGSFHMALTGSESGVARGISVSAVGQGQEFAFTHEVGHFIDFGDFGEGGKFTTTGGINMLTRDTTNVTMRAFFDAVDNSQAWLRLEEMRRNPGAFTHTVTSTGQTVRWAVDPKVVRYLQQPEEVFARAYSQWIAERTGDPAMLRGLARFQQSPYPFQWSSEDFTEIAAALEDLFAKAGMLR